MIDHVGERFEGTVSAFVGTGAFVDVLVRLEDLGAEYQIVSRCLQNGQASCGADRRAEVADAKPLISSRTCAF